MLLRQLEILTLREGGPAGPLSSFSRVSERPGAKSERVKLTTCLLVLLLVFCALTPAPAQQRQRAFALLVVVPERLPLDALEVERWMDLLKIERDRQHLSSEELPLLRLSMGRAQHRAALEKLGLQSSDRIRTFTCRRDANGWPEQILAEHEPGTPPDQVLARLVKQRSAPEAPSAEASLGLLLVTDANDAVSTRPFLEELGRFWLQRYGRVRPSPYPLASYDVAKPEVAEALARAFPQLTDGAYPLVALCAFSDGQPSQVLQVFRGLDTPASLVREVSAARGRALTAGVTSSPSAPSVPSAETVGLSSEQERVLLVSRLNETALQLWNGAKEDKSLGNQGPKRVLLGVIEDSRRYLAGDAGALGLLQESLRDYQVEPLKVDPKSRSAEQAARLLELSRTLLESP